MSLLIDLLSAQPVGATKVHGGGEYIKALAGEAIMARQDQSIGVCFDDEKYLDSWLLDLFDQNGVTVHKVHNPVDMYEAINSGCYDTFFSGLPFWFDRSFVKVPIRCIGTVHGLRTIEQPFDVYPIGKTRPLESIKLLVKRCGSAQYALRQISKYEKCISGLDIVITDSEHSKAAIKNVYKRDCVAYYPPPKHLEPIKEIEGLHGTNYILLISCNRWEKNPYRALDALDDLYSRGHLGDVQTVCVGGGPDSYVRRLRNPERFISMGYLEAGKLEWLYKNCLVFLYPTLNEGFGYPPLEAMKYGKTCVVSGTCSLPEVCGNAVYYVNPTNKLEIGTRVLQAVDFGLDSRCVIAQNQRVELRQRQDLNNILKLLLARYSPGDKEE